MKFLYIRLHTRPHTVWKAKILKADPLILDLIQASKTDKHLHKWYPHPDDEMSDQLFDPPPEYCRRYLPTAPVGHCRLCLKPVPKRRITWCSNECVDKYASQWDSHTLKRLAFARDKGVCLLCHRDTVKERKSVPWSGRRAKDIAGIEALGYPTSAATSLSGRRVWYELDHIVPVVEGGGAGGVDNLRTLCWICHKEETKKLAARSGERLRNARAVEREWLASLNVASSIP